MTGVDQTNAALNALRGRLTIFFPEMSSFAAFVDLPEALLLQTSRRAARRTTSASGASPVVQLMRPEGIAGASRVSV